MVKSGSLYIPDDEHFKTYFESHEVFEGENLKVAISACKSFRTAIDGGAHVGSWTRELAKKFSKVIAFEPGPDNYDCLLKNVSHLENVKTYDLALGHKRSRSELVTGTNSGSGYLTEGNSLDVVTVDSFQIRDLDFLKLDVEGYEPFALMGARETLVMCSPVVLVEQKPITARYKLPWDTAGKYLEGMGYKLFAKVNNDYVYRQ